MKRIIFGIAFMALLSSNASAQLYDVGLGIRAAPSFGFSVKVFADQENALELILHRRNNIRYRITALYERHNHFSSNWYFFYGFGGTLNIITDSDIQGQLGIGVDGILGLEYVAETIPISLGIDYKPGFNIIGASNSNNFFWDELGFSIRILLGS